MRGFRLPDCLPKAFYFLSSEEEFENDIKIAMKSHEKIRLCGDSSRTA
jgi:hypothetical protein